VIDNLGLLYVNNYYTDMTSRPRRATAYEGGEEEGGGMAGRRGRGGKHFDTDPEPQNSYSDLTDSDLSLEFKFLDDFLFVLSLF
jgi:hypothetical protein